MKYAFVERPKPTDPTDPVQVAAYTGYSVSYVRQLLSGIRRGQLPPWGAAPMLVEAGVNVHAALPPGTLQPGTVRPLTNCHRRPVTEVTKRGFGPEAKIRGARRPRPSRRGSSPSSTPPPEQKADRRGLCHPGGVTAATVAKEARR
jgi:hypothetical protein